MAEAARCRFIEIGPVAIYIFVYEIYTNIASVFACFVHFQCSLRYEGFNGEGAIKVQEFTISREECIIIIDPAPGRPRLIPNYFDS